MTALLVVESIVLLGLLVLVAGLLRSHGTILRRLHELEREQRPATSFRPLPGLSDPVPLDRPFAAGRPISGRTPDGQTVVIRTSGASGRTVLAFLSSGCTTCQAFWDAFADPALLLPADTRLVIVAKDASQESPTALANKGIRGIDVVMSGQAWQDYQVPGSPYVVAVDGASGRVVGEGTGMNWQQVAKLLAESTGDVGFVANTRDRVIKPQSDAGREARVDAELLAAGILPGDSSLYPAETDQDSSLGRR